LRSHAIEVDLDAILSNPVASTSPKWRTFKLLRLMQDLHQSTCDHEIVCWQIFKDEQLSVRPFFEYPKNTDVEIG
jgi:hypothetical protein